MTGHGHSANVIYDYQLSYHLVNQSDSFWTMLIFSSLLVMSQLSPWVSGQGIRSYRGEAEFKKVTLLWTLDSSSQLQKSSEFRIKFCENQIWGEHYCREQEVQGSRAQRSFSTKIHGEPRNNGNNSFERIQALVTQHRAINCWTLTRLSRLYFLRTDCGHMVQILTQPNVGNEDISYPQHRRDHPHKTTVI